MKSFEFFKCLIRETKIGLLIIFALFALSAQAFNYTTLINGNLYTNVNAALYSTTNSSGTITNNFQLGTVPASSNVVFYLSSSAGALPPITTTNALGSAGGTNNWPPVLPAQPFYPGGGVNGSGVGGYPNTLYGPYNNLLVAITYQSVFTNNVAGVATFIFAGSIDGVLWQTNLFSLALTTPVYSGAGTGLAPTNGIEYVAFASAAWPIIALQQINNAGTNAITNIVVEVTGKPGI